MTDDIICRCGHKHSDHDESRANANYSAGECSGRVVDRTKWNESVWKRCACKHFVMAKDRP